MKKKITIFAIILILIILGVFVFFKVRDKKSYTINETSKATLEINFSPEIIYFAVSTPEGEWIISGVDDIKEIRTRLSIVSDSYTYSGDFDYDLILSGCNAVGIVQSNFLVKGNTIENGGRIIKLDYNLEKYLKKLIKHRKYENRHSEEVSY